MREIYISSVISAFRVKLSPNCGAFHAESYDHLGGSR